MISVMLLKSMNKKFESCGKKGESIHKYISEFDQKYNKLKKKLGNSSLPHWLIALN